MSEYAINTGEMHGWLDRLKAGDSKALDALLTRVSSRLDRLARKMLKRFPRVSRWADAEDVLQNSTLRLIRALGAVRPNSMREFYALAATQIRRELLDLTKGLYGPHGEGAHHATKPPDAGPSPDAPALPADDHEMENWCQFHLQVEQLPPEEREVVGLIFYHGWKQQQVAELFGVTVRTVQRWWQGALEKLQAVMTEAPSGE